MKFLIYKSEISVKELMSRHHQIGVWSGFWFMIGAVLATIMAIIYIAEDQTKYINYIFLLSNIGYLIGGVLMMVQGDVKKIIKKVIASIEGKSEPELGQPAESESDSQPTSNATGAGLA